MLFSVLRINALFSGPFAGLLLADYGASVLRIDGPRSPPSDVLARHKSSINLDLKKSASKSILLDLLSRADVLIDPFRPHVLERLGLSPTDVLLKHNPRLTVARLSGFRRDGKYKDMAGHDINYIAVSGVLSMLGSGNRPPYAPGNLLGDFAGGGATCFMGILLALLARERTGRGQVIEANMVDGSAYMATFPRLARHSFLWDHPRGENFLDGGCPWYCTYETKDKGKYFAVGSLEPQFYQALLKGLGFENNKNFPDREDRSNWPTIRDRFAARFREKTRKEWEDIFDGTDACATPVLEQAELERKSWDQRHPVELLDTPGRPFSAEQGGWTGGFINKGAGGEESLQNWMGWQKGLHYIQEENGVLIKTPDSKL
jgi:alpha-methylacyl-CoA racemase